MRGANTCAAVQSREAAEAESTKFPDGSVQLRQDFQVLQEQVVARREELAAMSERLSSAESIEQRLSEELTLAGERMASLQQQHGGWWRKKRSWRVPASSLPCK
jgi:predicted  nucleic acid-binding Zn-ribbon protein